MEERLIIDLVQNLPELTKEEINGCTSEIELSSNWLGEILDNWNLDTGEIQQITQDLVLIEQLSIAEGCKFLLCGSFARFLYYGLSHKCRDIDFWIINQENENPRAIQRIATSRINNVLDIEEENKTLSESLSEDILVNYYWDFSERNPYNIIYFLKEKKLVDLYFSNIPNGRSLLPRLAIGSRANDIVVHNNGKSLFNGGKMNVIETRKMLMMLFDKGYSTNTDRLR